MIRFKSALAALFLSLALSAPALAAVPSMHQVYAAAHSGHLNQAQEMMRQVLQAYPNSAKAHYVEARLLAAQHHGIQARAELGRAEHIEPGLPFAQPAAVSELRQEIMAETAGQPVPAKRSGFPLTGVLVGVGILALLGFVLMRILRRRSAPLPPAVPGPHTASPYPPGTGYGGVGVPPPYGAPTAPGGGFGSALGTGLGAGLGLGAGMVAGEALADHFLDRNNANPDPGLANIPPDNTPAPDNADDLGGNDFGINQDDGGSWNDDGGADDGSSWDDGGGGDSSW